MTVLVAVLLVAIGGAVGAVARWGIGEGWKALRERDGRPSIILDLVPWPVFLANILASFLLGVFVAQLGSASAGGARLGYLLLGTGLCGAMSTLSSAAIEIVDLSRRRFTVIGVGYLLLSIGAGMSALWLGLVIGR
ncbi:fluoride efflux transporter FluC [Brachybacterium phenoliresistens]|uniref:Fluoride-specific ion channel FluC n=1 Tax=Brachybacterium phenoliresistens TaxID=396014 RepID=Z9JR66_9MICO|nr:CrcB family protein [Brachybacterium phenoliresistens]EWS80296.1 membrane protein [Brachybacterium phenoliresistens]